MLLAAARVLDPDMAQRLERAGMTLHQASQQGRASLVRAAEDLKAAAEDMAAVVDNADLASDATTRALLKEIVSDAMTRRYTNYSGAEQALFAVQRLTAAMGPASPAMEAAIEDASGYAQSPYSYDQTGFRGRAGGDWRDGPLKAQKMQMGSLEDLG